MFARRGLTETILVGTVLALSLLILLVTLDIVAAADLNRLGRYFQPFAGLAGTERTVVVVVAIVLLVLSASTFLSGGLGRKR